MEEIKFEINEQDIREYLKKHRNDEAIKYREAMFVKYMREHQEMTCESLEILMKKYNLGDKKINGIYHGDEFGILKSEPLSDFRYYLDDFSYSDDITYIDVSGICHILIPAVGYYQNIKGYRFIENPCYKLHYGLGDLSMKLLNTVPKDINDQLALALDDYCTLGKVEYTYTNIGHSGYVYSIRMGKDTCRHELEEYSHIYGEEPVKQIRKIMRESERMRM